MLKSRDSNQIPYKTTSSCQNSVPLRNWRDFIRIREHQANYRTRDSRVRMSHYLSYYSLHLALAIVGCSQHMHGGKLSFLSLLVVGGSHKQGKLHMRRLQHTCLGHVAVAEHSRNHHRQVLHSKPLPPIGCRNPF